jgi:ABC-type transport system involved in multi-copper enzyme maturation permease subunit
VNSKTTRILKEAHGLFWPWCAVMTAGALPLVPGPHPDWTEGIAFTGFFIGFPLLATLSLGNEFQHRTLSLLLSQPVSRMEIWREKLSVTLVAVLSAALVFYYGWGWRSVFQQNPKQWVFAGVYVIAIMASATFWTLLARSTIGGLALSGLAMDVFLASIVIVGHVLGYWRVENWEEIVGPHSAKTVVSIAALCYAGVMLWLGGRKLARFQVTGGMAGDDLLMTGPNVMPGALAGWFRCRPTGALLNLVRKELRLLQPLWLITLLNVTVWICLILFRSTKNPPFTMILVSLGSLYAILAGSLSLGEERTSGTHSWHMTLPVSASRQWLIKLVMAMLAGFVCAALLPVLVLIAGGFLFGSPFMFVDPHAGMVWLLVVLLLTFASFWCACAVNGMVRAVLWVFPVLGALYLVGRCGDWVAQELMGLFVSRFDLFTYFRFTNAVSNLMWIFTGATLALVATLLVGPTLLVAVIQSYRLFRTQVQDSKLSVIRKLGPLALVAFLCSFSLVAFSSFVFHAREQMGTLFRETHEAIEKIQPGAANLDATHPLELTVDDLAKASPLSERTRRWLRNSTITVNPHEAHPGRYGRGGIGWGASFAPDGAFSRYLATIHLESGSDCTLSFEAARGLGIGILGGVCK